MRIGNELDTNLIRIVWELIEIGLELERVLGEISTGLHENWIIYELDDNLMWIGLDLNET